MEDGKQRSRENRKVGPSIGGEHVHDWQRWNIGVNGGKGVFWVLLPFTTSHVEMDVWGQRIMMLS